MTSTEAPSTSAGEQQQQRGSRFEELKAQGSARKRADKPGRAAFKDVVRGTPRDFGNESVPALQPPSADLLHPCVTILLNSDCK